MSGYSPVHKACRPDTDLLSGGYPALEAYQRSAQSVDLLTLVRNSAQVLSSFFALSLVDSAPFVRRCVDVAQGLYGTVEQRTYCSFAFVEDRSDFSTAQATAKA